MDVEELVAGAQEVALAELLRHRLVKTLVVANPAVGADFTQTVPAGALWEVMAASGVLTTSAVVANRAVTIAGRDADGNRLWQAGSTAVQAASLANRYSFMQGLGNTQTTGLTSLALPSPAVALPSGGSVAAITGAIDVGDQWSAVVVVVREWTERAIVEQLRWLSSRLR